MITYKTKINNDHLEKLCNEVEWTAYTKDMALLYKAFSQSLKMAFAWNDDRLVEDGPTIVYVQDLLVLKDYQNQGIATQLMQHILEIYREVWQKVLLTEEEPGVRHFYKEYFPIL